jgi:hypothetical protein
MIWIGQGAWLERVDPVQQPHAKNKTHTCKEAFSPQPKPSTQTTRGSRARANGLLNSVRRLGLAPGRKGGNKIRGTCIRNPGGNLGRKRLRSRSTGRPGQGIWGTHGRGGDDANFNVAGSAKC